LKSRRCALKEDTWNTDVELANDTLTAPVVAATLALPAGEKVAPNPDRELSG
jgi:hypothetical protein